MTTPSTKDKGYNTIVIASVFLLGAFIRFLNSAFMNI